MIEIKKELIELDCGVQYTPGESDYVITEDHSLADIIRFVVLMSGGDTEDARYILDTIDACKSADA